MRKIRKRHVTHPRHKPVVPFNFVSGLVYAAAVIVSIALGGLFYKGIRNAQIKTHAKPKGAAVAYPDLPPGAKVVSRAEREAAAARNAKPPAIAAGGFLRFRGRWIRRHRAGVVACGKAGTRHAADKS